MVKVGKGQIMTSPCRIWIHLKLTGKKLLEARSNFVVVSGPVSYV